jgi:hypothetical protein
MVVGILVSCLIVPTFNLAQPFFMNTVVDMIFLDFGTNAATC